MPVDNAVYPPVHLPGRDVRVADDVIDECLQTPLSILQYTYLVDVRVADDVIDECLQSADNAVYPPVHLPGRDVRVADDVIDECLQTTLSNLQYTYLVETSG